MSVDALATCLLEQLHHELATDVCASQLKDSNYEDEHVREELEPILHDTDNFALIFDEAGKLAEKIVAGDGDNTWKTLVAKDIDVTRVNALYWVFLDKALAKNSNTRDVEYGFAAACSWLRLAGQKGATLFHFFNQYMYKMVLSVLRLIYRLKMYGSRYATTNKKKGAGKGKKGAKKSGPMREEPQEEEEHPLEFRSTELDDILEKACDALYTLLKNTPLSTCSDQAKESVDLVRDLIRLDISKETETAPLMCQRDLRSRDRISDRAFGLAHLLCESRHSSGGLIVHTRLILPRLLFFSWEGEVVPGSQTIPAVMNVARDAAIGFLKHRLIHSQDQDEMETIAKLVSNMMARCSERSEYRMRVSQSALELLSILPKKTAQAQLQLMYTFGLTPKTGLRAFAVEMIPTVMKTMDLDPEVEEEANKSKRKEKEGREEEERGKKEKKKKSDDEEESEEEGDTTKRKKKNKKDSGDEEDEEEEDGNKTKRKEKNSKNKKDSEEEEEEGEEGNKTKRKGKKSKKAKGSDEEEEEEEDEGNTTKRRGRTAKDQSMMKQAKQEKRQEEEEEEEEEESEGEAERKRRKKREAERVKEKRRKMEMRSAPVELRPNLLVLMVRACMDKTGSIRSRALQQVAAMVEEGGMGEELKEAAGRLMREHPRIILQATSRLDEEEGEGVEEEEDEEKRARAAQLAELAAAELQIENGLVYVVKERMEDDVAAVRKSAVACMQTLFFQWTMGEEEAEETVRGLKLRCLDSSLMVRKQAMETLSALLEEGLEKGHRSLLESTWLRAVLPLINDRENSVQAMAARLVEEHLISPIMRPQTPEACWHLVKRVEEEVSNRRLLVRTLAYLSQQNTIKEKVVEVLNKKLTSDPDHANVIWMLLADLSTVFKIDPRTAVKTWYELKEDESANMLSYVAKVVGEGSTKLNDEERDRVARDIEEKLMGYRIHGPHIATVYLALARLMDAVGELGTGTEVLERFGRNLLNEASRIIYSELEMFAEKEEDQQHVTKEEEIRVIRIVITIGEVVQLSPNLIDHAEKLLEGLKCIMASELYLSDMYRNRKHMNSAVQSRVPSAMGGTMIGGGGGQGMENVTVQAVLAHSEQPMGTQGSSQSQPHVIPSQVAKEMHTKSLRKALFTATVRRCALTTIGKFCLMDEKIAKACVDTFVKQLKLNPDHIIRNNIVIVLCDLCIRYTLLVDRYTPIIASCLKDRATLVRHQTLECLTILIKEAFIRWEGQLMYRFVATILDECRPIREYATFCLKDILLPQNPCMFFNHFIECLLYFNDVPRKYAKGDKMEAGLDERGVRFTLSGKSNEPARIKLYEFMLATFDDKQKFITMAKMCEEIFSAVYSGERNIEDERVVALLTDAFKVIACEQMQLKLETGRKEGEEEEDAPQAVVAEAKNMITKVFRDAIITAIMPHVLELRRFLLERRHPIMKYMMGVLRALTRSHMDSLQEFFAGDRLALREIEYDIKRLNNLEEKMKLRAAREAAEAERAAAETAAAPSRRQSMGVRDTTAAAGEEEKKKKREEEEERQREVEREVPVHPMEMEVDGGEGEVDQGGEKGGEMEVEMGGGETSGVERRRERREEEEKEKEGEGEEKEDVEMEEVVEEFAATAADAAKEVEKPAASAVAAAEKPAAAAAVEEGEKEKEGEASGEKENEQPEEVEEEEEERQEEREKEKKKKKKPAVTVEEEEEGPEERGKERKEEGEKEKKKPAVTVEVKEEEEEGDKENEEREKEKRKRKEVAEVEIKEEPIDEEEEVQFVRPVGGLKRPRAASEVGWMNETAMVGGYGQSTPRKGSPVEEEGEEEERGGVPRLDLDISAIAPPPGVNARGGGGRGRVSRKPQTGRIEE